MLCLQLLGEIPDPARFSKKCAPGHQAHKTASDEASGAYFQVGFWWASNSKLFMLLSSTTRALGGPYKARCVRGGHCTARPGYLSGFAFEIEECMFQIQNIESIMKHSRNSYLVSCLQLLGEVSDPARFIKNVLLATRLPKLLQMGPLVHIFR